MIPHSASPKNQHERKRKLTAWQLLGRVEVINRNPNFQLQFPKEKKVALNHLQQAFWRMLAAKMNLSWLQFLEQLKKGRIQSVSLTFSRPDSHFGVGYSQAQLDLNQPLVLIFEDRNKVKNKNWDFVGKSSTLEYYFEIKNNQWQIHFISHPNYRFDSVLISAFWDLLKLWYFGRWVDLDENPIPGQEKAIRELLGFYPQKLQPIIISRWLGNKK